MSDSPQRIELCSTSDVDLGTAIKVETNGLVLAVFNVNDAFYVTDDTCTHGPGSLSEGYITDDVVECDFHNGAQHPHRRGGSATVHDPPTDLPDHRGGRESLHRGLTIPG